MTTVLYVGGRFYEGVMTDEERKTFEEKISQDLEVAAMKLCEDIAEKIFQENLNGQGLENPSGLIKNDN